MKNKAFTLAEVIIVIGVIAVVAEFVLPQLLTDLNDKILQAQFKKAYATFNQLVSNARNELGLAFECFYWIPASSPYGPHYCAEYSEDGSSCLKYLMLADDSPIPSDINGLRADCAALKVYMDQKLTYTKICPNNAVPSGCIPAYKGLDSIAVDSGSTDSDALKATVGSGYFRQSSIHNSDTAYNLSDGMNLILYGTSLNCPVFLVDINGSKPPNKWGYDLVSFRIAGDGKGVRTLSCGYSTVEKGGKSCATRLKQLSQ